MDRYPNLQTIKDKAIHILGVDYNIKPKFPSDISMQCFEQTFADTACLFRKNESDFAGQSFTTEFITVVDYNNGEIIMLFQGDRPVYGLSGDYNKDLFWEDVKNKNIATFSKSEKYSKG